MFPLIPLPTDGWSKKDKANDGPMDDAMNFDPDSEKAKQEWRKELREPSETLYEVKKEIKLAFGQHEPLKTEVPGVACRAIEGDRAMLALSMWTSHWTFRLIAAYHQLKRGLPFMNCNDLTGYCELYLSKKYGDREKLERILLLPLFFAPTEWQRNTEFKVALSDILADRHKEFDTLGCAFLKEPRSAECDLAFGLLCTVNMLANANRRAPVGGPWTTLPTFAQGKANVEAQTSKTMDAAAVVRKEHEWNVYAEQTLQYLEQGNDPIAHKKHASMLVAATEEVARTLEDLWVEVPVAAGPLFRGDATPEDWVNTGNWARWPVATSFVPSTVDSFIGDTAKRTPGTRLAILLAPRVRCIDIDSRMGLEASEGGGRWLSCNNDEGELLIHPDTRFYQPRKTDGTFLYVKDVRNNHPDWKTAISLMFSNENWGPPDLSTFEEALKGTSGMRPTTFGNFRITVGFDAPPEAPPEAPPDAPPGNSKKTRKNEREGGRKKATKIEWTDFSDLAQYL